MLPLNFQFFSHSRVSKFSFSPKDSNQQTFNSEAIKNDKEKGGVQRSCTYLCNVNLQQNYVSPLLIFNIILHNHKKCLMEKYFRLNNYLGKNWQMNFI